MSKKIRKRRVYLNLALLVLLLISSLVLYLVLRQTETGEKVSLPSVLQGLSKDKRPIFSEGNQVILVNAANSPELSPYLHEVGQVMASQADAEEVTYTVRYGDVELYGLSEEHLRAIVTPVSLNQTVALVNGPAWGEYADGQVTGITVEGGDGQVTYTYQATFPTIGSVTDLTAEDFVWFKELELLETNTAAENNAILQEALNASKEHAKSRLIFPQGRFLIGSQTPEQDYIVLSSNIELVGNETSLVVDGSARWFGLATGASEVDGLSNFSMSNLTFEANDLVNGNQFILMANHGSNWSITNNRFIMVHKLSSHIFDLGGVQDAAFYYNSFEGYAPELTGVTEIGSRSLHNFIAEAIQLDASSNNGEWDGGMLKAIDPDYEAHNPTPFMSDNITIAENQFIPYWNNDGVLVAYGAGVGQHSSGIGYAHIYNNVFSDTLSLRYQDLVAEGERWLFNPIHLPEGSKADVYDNWLN